VTHPLDGLRVGVFGARADRRGLAIQSEEFARHALPDRVLGIDMGDKSPLLCDWSGFDAKTLTVRRLDRLDHDDVRRWLRGLDVVFGCETFYVPWFTSLARQERVATVLQVNPEFAKHVYDWVPVPDVVANPTRWRMEHLPGAVHLPVGIARDRVRWRRRDRLDVLLHVMGHAAAHDRNGTRLLLEALRGVRSPLGVVVRSQRPLRLDGWAARLPSNVELEVRAGDVAHYWDLYGEGDAMALPRRYGGLCLVAQEALSAGMPVLMPACEPNGDLLPADWLVPLDPRSVGHFACSAGRLELQNLDAAALAERIDRAAADPQVMRAWSVMADRAASKLEWANVLPAYRRVFDEAVNRRKATT
jgi:glycosyltransferase involved in cell wall biosynthesis